MPRSQTPSHFPNSDSSVETPTCPACSPIRNLGNAENSVESISESRIDSTREFPHAAAGMHAECRPAVASCRTIGDPNTGVAASASAAKRRRSRCSCRVKLLTSNFRLGSSGSSSVKVRGVPAEIAPDPDSGWPATASFKHHYTARCAPPRCCLPAVSGTTQWSSHWKALTL